MKLTPALFAKLDDPDWLADQLRYIAAEYKAPDEPVMERGAELAVLTRTTLIGLLVKISEMGSYADLLRDERLFQIIAGALSMAFAMGLKDGGTLEGDVLMIPLRAATGQDRILH